MPHSRPHIIVNDLRIGWGSRVLMEHVTFDVNRGTTLAILGGSGSRMIEPRLVDPEPLASAKQGPTAADAIPVRLLETQARAHIGRRLLHQEADGELVEDAVWLWSSAPARYLDSALRVAFASSPDVRLVDSGNATAIAVTLIAWHVESAGSVRLVGAVELVMTSADRTVQAQVIRGSEPVSSELPGNLAAAAGRLLQTLVSDSLMRATQVSGGSAQGLPRGRQQTSSRHGHAKAVAALDAAIRLLEGRMATSWQRQPVRTMKREKLRKNRASRQQTRNVWTSPCCPAIAGGTDARYRFARSMTG
jgi:hypothetical protein